MEILKSNCLELFKTDKAIGFLLKGMEDNDIIWMPRSQIKCFPDFEKATRFIIPDWIWDQKMDELYK